MGPTASTTWPLVTSVTWEGESLSVGLIQEAWVAALMKDSTVAELHKLSHTHHRLQVIWGPLAYY